MIITLKTLSIVFFILSLIFTIPFINHLFEIDDNKRYNNEKDINFVMLLMILFWSIFYGIRLFLP